MHKNNKLWLKKLKNTYPKSFSGAKVLELGSGVTTKDLVIRSYFKNCEYAGVDIVGEEQGVYGVDVVSNAGSTKFKNDYFDTLICFSMFEHDSGWKKSISHNLKFLKPGGMIYISFGADGNRRHDPEPWQFVKYDDFLKYCFTLPLNIIDAFFEEERFGYDCAGAFDFVAQKVNDKKNIKSFKIEKIKRVPAKNSVQLLKDNILYYAFRFRRNLYNFSHIGSKYFYNQ